MKSSDFLEKLKLKVPLIVAPMAGGPSSLDLIAASCEAGALGSVGAAYMSAEAIEQFVSQVRAKTSKPIAINLFLPAEETFIGASQMAAAFRATKPFREELGLAAPILAPPFEENFDVQFEMVLKLKPEVFSFVFGILQSDFVKAARKNNIFLIGTATSVEEALELQDSGVDAVTLQGVEGGGHRGLFSASMLDPEIPLAALLDQCAGNLKIPFVAAGGIMTAEDVRGALRKGASAVQMGTAFLTCKEAGTSVPYRKALLESTERKTKTTRAFSGRLARGLTNRFMLELEKTPEAILPFPAQNKFTRDIRGASAKLGSSEFLSLWSGMGKGELWTGSAQNLIENLFKI